MCNHGISSDVVKRCQNQVEQDILVRTYQHKDWRPDCTEAWRTAGEVLSRLITPEKNVVTTQRNSVTAQIARYFAQEQGESAEFTGVNEHFQRGYWAK